MKYGRRHFERGALLAVAVIAVLMMIMAFRFERRLINQRLMFYQLQSMRKSVELYKAITKQNPQSLKVLATTDFSFPGEEQKHRYLESPGMNDRGFFMDPFGHPFLYDAKSGWVKSSTPGYEFW